MSKAVKLSKAVPFGLAVVALLVGAGAASAQGCPWCTTPTKCEPVDETTDISGCLVTQEAGCQEFGDGCEPIETLLASEGGKAQLKRLGIELLGTRVIQMGALGERTAGVLVDGKLAVWSCQGELQALFGQDEEGRYIVYDHSKDAARLSLRGTADAVQS